MPYLITLIIYIVSVYIIGFIANLSNRKLADFILANRKLSGPLVAFGVGASDMSGWLLMAFPGAVFLYGLNQIWLPCGLIIGAYTNWQYVAKRLRIYSELANDSLTIPTYLNNRFTKTNDKPLRIVTALTSITFFTFYISAGFVSCAILAQTIFEITYLKALLLGSTIMILYTFIGGFLAITWLDLFQGSLMFISLLIVPYITSIKLGGINTVIHNISFPEHYFNMFHNINIIGILSLLGWGLGYFGQPHLLVRFMAIRSSHEIAIARSICITWMILSLVGALATGILGQAYFNQLANPETVFITLSKTLFNPWISGVLIAAVLSAILSTVTAQLLSSASIITEDIYHAFFRTKAKDKELLLISRITVIIVALFALLFALSASNTILKLVGHAWAGLGASFGPIIIMSLYWKKMTKRATVFGMLVGATTTIIWPYLQIFPFQIFTLYEIIPAFIFNVLTIYIISYIDYEKNPSFIAMDFSKLQESLNKKP